MRNLPVTHRDDALILVECWHCGHEQYFDSSSDDGRHCEECGASLSGTLVNWFGDPLADNLLPLGLGLMVALVYILGGGDPFSLLAGPLIAWGAWQLRRWGERLWSSQ